MIDMFPQGIFKLTSDHKQILKQATFNDTQPGTLLHDFSAILDILKREHHILTPKYQLPMKLLSEINDSLSNPIQLGLKRPQQKSYPHIHGLYLLVRASGLSVVDTKGKKPKLVIDDKIYEQWKSFNPTEQYGNLLEAWLIRGFEDIIGERRKWGGIPDHMRQIVDFVGGLRSKNKYALEYMGFYPGWHNIGLLDLFGMINIQYGQVIEGKGIQIENVEITPFGNALVNLIFERYFVDLSIMELDTNESELFGELQSKFSDYFPEWKRTIEMPKWEFREGTYTFKVSLGKQWSSRIKISGQSIFDEFAYGILHAVQFDSDHLYEFTFSSRLGTQLSIYHPYMDDYPHTDEVKIGDVPLNIGMSFTFLFDFGDNWLFDIELEAYDETLSTESLEIVETKGEPPEQYNEW